jgi:hypothetical protein
MLISQVVWSVEWNESLNGHTHERARAKGDNQFSSATSCPFNGGISLGLPSYVVKYYIYNVTNTTFIA